MVNLLCDKHSTYPLILYQNNPQKHSIYFLSIKLTILRIKPRLPHITMPETPRATVSPIVLTRSS